MHQVGGGWRGRGGGGVQGKWSGGGGGDGTRAVTPLDLREVLEQPERLGERLG